MLLDAVYYSFISLSTIGFGDFIPSMEPPLRYATYIRNDTACFEALINPIPSQDLNQDSGLSNLCNPTIWPTNIEYLFNMYRVMVFFWILAGLVWLGGVISIMTEMIRNRGKNFAKMRTKLSHGGSVGETDDVKPANGYRTEAARAKYIRQTTEQNGFVSVGGHSKNG